MEWSSKGRHNPRTGFNAQEDIDNIIGLLPDELENIFALARESKESLNEITQDILNNYNNIKSLDLPQKNDEETKKLSENFFDTLSQGQELKYLPALISQGADINASVKIGRVIETLPLPPFIAALGLGVAASHIYIPLLIPVWLSAQAYFFYNHYAGHNIKHHNVSMTLLNKALNDHDTELVEYLLAHGADCNKLIQREDIVKHCLENNIPLYCYPNIMPLPNIISKKNLGLARQLLGYNATISDYVFSKELLQDSAFFVLLFNTYLFRLAKEHQFFVNARNDIATFISALPIDGRTAFLLSLKKNINIISNHFKNIHRYFDGIKNKLGLYIVPNLSKSELIDDHVEHLAATEIHHEADLEKVTSFCFDRKQINCLLASIFQAAPLDELREDTQAREKLRFYIKSLLELGAYINIYFPFEGLYVTPLHVAILKDNAYFVEYLLEQEADANMTDNRGRRPLHMLTSKQDTIANLLLKNKANPNLTDSMGNKAVDYLATMLGMMYVFTASKVK